ncbi:MAG: DUF2142 domain-containing protein, partial [Candidatus Aminicenantes bacterium]|nr:DUF2142 domain-containing protein [Candidatus Aminicenantes bacterium]
LFLPQALIISLAVAPDAWCMLLGAVFFSAALALAGGDRRPIVILGLSGAVFLGLPSDKSTLAFIPLAILCPLFAVQRQKTRRTLLLVVTFLVFALAVAYAVCLLFPREVESNFVHFYERIRHALTTFGGSVDGYFINLLAESFFLKFGWMVFGAPGGVVFVWKLSCAAAGIGLLCFFLRKRKSRAFRIILFASLAVGLQVLLLRLMSISPERTYGQGRYLFPVLMPLALLFVVGLQEAFNALGRGGRLLRRKIRPLGPVENSLSEGGSLSRPAGLGDYAVWIFLILEFLFLGWAVWGLVVPGFHLTRLTPYPGI